MVVSNMPLRGVLFCQVHGVFQAGIYVISWYFGGVVCIGNGRRVQLHNIIVGVEAVSVPVHPSCCRWLGWGRDVMGGRADFRGVAGCDKYSRFLSRRWDCEVLQPWSALPRE